MQIQTTADQHQTETGLDAVEYRRLVHELEVLEARAAASGRATDQMLLAITRSCLTKSERAVRARRMS